MTAAWVIILVHLEWARMDLEKITDRTIPSWVDGMVRLPSQPRNPPPL